MKKLVSLLLALVLVFAISSVAMAATYEVGTAADFEAKLEAAVDGDVIVLTDNIEITDPADSVGNGLRINLTGSGEITVDFAGHEISITSNVTNSVMRLCSYNSAMTVIMKDGTINAGTDYAWRGLFVTGVGKSLTVDLQDMVIKNDKQGGAAIFNYSGATVNLTDCTVYSGKGVGVDATGATSNIYTSTFIQDGAYSAAYPPCNVAVASGGVVNVYSGTFTAEYANVLTMSSGGTINVYGGTFESENIGAQAICDSNYDCDAVINIAGGSFKAEVAIQADYHGAGDEKPIVNVTAGTLEGDVKASADSEVNISGGTIDGDIVDDDNADPSSVNVSTGTVNGTVPDAALAPGYEKDGDEIVVKTGMVAKNSKGAYASLQEAVDAAVAGDTITMLDTVELTYSVYVDKKIVLDLNGHTITTASDWVYANSNDALLVVKYGGDLTIDDSSAGKTGVITNGNAKAYAAVKMTEKDEVYAGEAAKLTVNAGSLTGMYYAIAGNGGRDNTEITINGGTFTASEAVENGEYGLGIFHPQNGKLTINGGEITGVVGLYFKSGELKITGGTFNGIGKVKDYSYHKSGANSTGDAVVIENVGGETGYEAISSVEITGGTFESANAAAVGSYAATSTNADAEAETGFITGGTFEGAEAMDEDLIAEGAKFEYVGDKLVVNAPAKSAKRYDINVADTKNGDVAVKGSASYDSGVVITATPYYGYEVGTVTVTDEDGDAVKVTNRADGTYSFSMPRGEVTVKVTFVPQGEAVKMVLTIGSKDVVIGGKTVVNDVAPVIKASRTFLPVRLIAENLGASVTWDEPAQRVVVAKGETTIELFINSTTVLVNGQPAELEAPVFIENSRTYLPVRFIAEKLGADVEWDGATNEVTITGRK